MDMCTTGMDTDADTDMGTWGHGDMGTWTRTWIYGDGGDVGAAGGWRSSSDGEGGGRCGLRRRRLVCMAGCGGLGATHLVAYICG